MDEFFFLNIISSFSLHRLDLQCKYRVPSIEDNPGIVRYQRNYGIDPVLMTIFRNWPMTSSN